MNINLVDLIRNHNGFEETLKGDDGIRILLQSAVEQEFYIIPFLDKNSGKNAYSIWKLVDGEELALMPILQGDWIEGFPRIENE